MSNDLKPCPFCGDNVNTVGSPIVGDDARRAYCVGCESRGPWKATDDEAYAAFTEPAALAAAVQAEREACARVIGDLRTADTVTARAVVIDGMRAIRSRGPAPAVDVLAVVREFVESIEAHERTHMLIAQWAKFDALRALVSPTTGEGKRCTCDYDHVNDDEHRPWCGGPKPEAKDGGAKG